MYREHVKEIILESKKDMGLESITRFVLHTIRRPFYQVSKTNKLSNVALEGYKFAVDNVETMTRELADSQSLEEKVRTFIGVKGINIPKAGFALQLIGEPIGCIDTHNATFLGVDSKALVLDKGSNYKPEKVWRYIGMCNSSQLSNPEVMWDRWCEFIADKYPKKFKGPEHVSQLHVEKVKEIREAAVKGEF